MNCQNKRYCITNFLTIMIVTLYYTMVFPDTVTTIGFKTNYSTGISDTNIAYKPYVRLVYEISDCKIEATGTYISHLQITDGMGNFTEINTGQGQITTLLSLSDIVEFGGGYSLSKGQHSYNSNMLMVNGSLYIGNATVDLDYSKEEKKYFYNYDIDIINQTFLGSVSYDVSDDIGCELEYHYLSNYFSSLDYTYYKNLVRLGIMVYSDHTIYMAGVNAGTDSGDYVICGADVGLSKKVYAGIKIIVAYNVDYYNSPSISSTSGGGHGGKNAGGYKGTNPYLRSDLAGKSFFSHSLNASLSYSF
ncbi:MAG: hypothetical protein ACUVRK_13385 [Spirochaetota bacterium]